MRYKLVAFIIPCALALSACTTVTPAYKDNGTRAGPASKVGRMRWRRNFTIIRSSIGTTT